MTNERNSDSNHVDRVRLPDSSYEFGGPGRGSGWRQRSLSNIDLTSQSRHSFTKQIRDYSSGLYDLYSRIESRKDYQENSSSTGGTTSKSTSKSSEKHKSESIYDRIIPSGLESSDGGGANGNNSGDSNGLVGGGLSISDSCSLRRTRSLAVIREETYNDLQISGVRTRRSQLIPRAKLTNRSFFKNKSNHKYRGEDDSGSGVDTQTSETRESDDYYANLKKLESASKSQQQQQNQQNQQNQQQTTPVKDSLNPPVPQQSWSNDKSDLDSLDSDYFKNSCHQPAHALSNNTTNKTITTKTVPSTKTSDSSSTIQVLEIEVHNQNIRHSISTVETNETLNSSKTTTTTLPNSEHLSSLYSTTRTVQSTTESSKTLTNNFEDIPLDNNTITDDSSVNNCELNINYKTLTLTRHRLRGGDSEDGEAGDEESFERKTKFKEDRKSVVSYDSIYLSSEGSNEHTIIDENEQVNFDDIEDSLQDLEINSDLEFDPAKEEFNGDWNKQKLKQEEKRENNLDSLYSQINKNKPKILSLEPKCKKNNNSNLTSFSDTSTRGTLERLTFISTTKEKDYQQHTEQQPYSVIGTVNLENQYCSLPDANIGISLRASERIDAKLRLSCNGSVVVTGSEEIISDQNNNLIYDSISRFGKAHKRLRQRENIEIVVLNSISIDENQKELKPQIELTQPIKEIDETIVENDEYPSLVSDCKIAEKPDITVSISHQPETKQNECKEIEKKKEKVEPKKLQISKTIIEPCHVKLQPVKDISISEPTRLKLQETIKLKPVEVKKSTIKEPIKQKSVTNIKQEPTKSILNPVNNQKSVETQKVTLKESVKLRSVREDIGTKKESTNLKLQEIIKLKPVEKKTITTPLVAVKVLPILKPIDSKEILSNKQIPVSKKQIIVDELAAKTLSSSNNAVLKQKDDPESQKKNISITTLKPNTKTEEIAEFKFIVTDHQNNIVEETKVLPATKLKPAKTLENFTPPTPFIQKSFDTEIPIKITFKQKRSLTDLTHESFRLSKKIAQLYPPQREELTTKLTQPKITVDPPPPPPPPPPITVSSTTSPSLAKPPPPPPLPVSKAPSVSAISKPKSTSSSSIDATTPSETLRNEFKLALTDTLRKRIANSRNIFNARPIRISSVDNLSKLNDTYEITPSLAYKVQIKEHGGKSSNTTHTTAKMSRPQILNVVDTKRNVCSVAPRQAKATSTTVDSTELNGNKIIDGPEVKKEFREKVDSVRCYWSKLIEEKKQQQQQEEEDQQQQQRDERDREIDEVDNISRHMSTKSTSSSSNINDQTNLPRNFVTSLEDTTKNESSDSTGNVPNRFKSEQKVFLRNTAPDCAMSSFSPMIEIIELDGQNKAAIVNAKDFDAQQFDHVRYKVMKSDIFQKNILTQSRKEAQFDGLLQYLQDYSFQELLANNNVVIIEPIRTKIEKSSGKKSESQTLNCKITGGSNNKSGDIKSSGLKRHFFYHPIRVNKELLDEELPTPDTVRNARKLFEETLRLRTNSTDGSNGGTGIGLAGGSVSSRDDSHTSKNTDNLRKKALRYLTIDTSFNGDGQRKWDSSSMSSGISSGELSSPCECTEHGGEQKDMFSSEENICGDDMCESYYVSQDVLAKIRECGSSVTYYGGRVVDNKSPEVSPMTKAIMQEIRGHNKVCGVCQPHNCPHVDKLFPPKNHENENLGLKFKLVKSNSCSSRLELAGTGLDEQQLRDNQTYMEQIRNRSTSPILDAEESVRTLVSRLEDGSFNQKTMPRIIDSKCIEKMTEPIKTPQQQEQNPLLLTINNQMPVNGNSNISIKDDHRLKPAVDILNQVTVNNHISFSSPIQLNQAVLVAAAAAGAAATATVTGGNVNTTPSAGSAANQQIQRSSSISPPPTTTTAPTSAPIETNRLTKVGRNKNVDLAFNMNKTGTIVSSSIPADSKSNISNSNVTAIISAKNNDEINTNTNSNANTNTNTNISNQKSMNAIILLEKENQQNSLGTHTNSTQTTTYLKNAKNLLNHTSEPNTTDPPPTMVSTRKSTTNNIILNTAATASIKPVIGGTTVTISNNNNNNNNNNNTNNNNNNNKNSNSSGDINTPNYRNDNDENKIGVGIDEKQSNSNKDSSQQSPPRLVKWNTLSKFDEKNYVANDAKLKQKPKYDDIEFEEFEVYDPNNPNGECYDSLNSNCK